MKEINLSEILKNAPKGLQLWSIIHGYVLLKDTEGDIICETDMFKGNDALQFDEYGHWLYGIYDDRCLFSKSVVLFPSKDCLSWENFKAPWQHKHFEPFQKVLVACPREKDDIVYWEADLFNRQTNNLYITVINRWLTEDEIIPYEGNEELLGTRVK